MARGFTVVYGALPGTADKFGVIFPPLLMDSDLLQESHNTLQAFFKLDMKRIPFWPVGIGLVVCVPKSMLEHLNKMLN